MKCCCILRDRKSCVNEITISPGSLASWEDLSKKDLFHYKDEFFDLYKNAETKRNYRIGINRLDRDRSHYDYLPRTIGGVKDNEHYIIYSLLNSTLADGLAVSSLHSRMSYYNAFFKFLSVKSGGIIKRVKIPPSEYIKIESLSYEIEDQ